MSTDFTTSLAQVAAHVLDRHRNLSTLPVLANPIAISHSISSLPPVLPSTGLGTAKTVDYLLDTLLPGILQAQNGSRYFGFVTGGVTEAAQLADILVGSYDENVQVTLEGITASTAIESRTLDLVLDLLDIKRDVYLGRTITTGATSANTLGLTCARNHLYSISPHLPPTYNFSQDGPPSSPTLPSPAIVMFVLHPHYSILKAASLVGLGNGPRVVQTLPCAKDDELAFDLDFLEKRLKEEKAIGRGVIVVWGLGEVNTGGFGNGLGEVARLCKAHGSWLHIDAAFGGFAGLQPDLRPLVEHMDKADSLTLDAHKWLNVPYDCGLFFTRSASALPTIFAPSAANTPAYLSAAPSTASTSPQKAGEVVPGLVPSPLYINIENSRRFRALPLFASLISLGKDGYSQIIQNNINFARRLATYIHASPHYSLLNHSALVSPATYSEAASPITPLNVVLFAPSPESPFGSAADATKAINDTRIMYVTGTSWRGQGAIRLAVSSWRTGNGGEEEVAVITKVLEDVVRAKAEAVEVV